LNVKNITLASKSWRGCCGRWTEVDKVRDALSWRLAICVGEIR